MEFNRDTAPVGWYLWQSDSIYGSDDFCIGTMQFIVIGVLKLLTSMSILVSISTSLITSTKTKMFGRGCEKTLHEYTIDRWVRLYLRGSTTSLGALKYSAYKLCDHLRRTTLSKSNLDPVSGQVVGESKKSESTKCVYLECVHRTKCKQGDTRSDSEMPAALHIDGGGRVYAAQGRTTWP